MNLPNFHKTHADLTEMLRLVGSTNPAALTESLAKHYSVSQDIIKENIAELSQLPRIKTDKRAR